MRSRWRESSPAQLTCLRIKDQIISNRSLTLHSLSLSASPPLSCSPLVYNALTGTHTLHAPPSFLPFLLPPHTTHALAHFIHILSPHTPTSAHERTSFQTRSALGSPTADMFLAPSSSASCRCANRGSPAHRSTSSPWMHLPPIKNLSKPIMGAGTARRRAPPTTSSYARAPTQMRLMRRTKALLHLKMP